MRALIYARVSTEEQAKGHSIPEQLLACRAKAEALAAGRPCTIVEITDDYGGDVLERPKLQQALDLVRAGGATYWVCHNPDRFSRDLTLQLLVAADIERAGCELVFTDYSYDRSPQGILFFQIRGAISQFEKATILERMARGARGKARAGGVPHMLRLYGYRFVAGLGKQAKAAQVLVPDELERSWLLSAYRWAADENLGGGGIAKRLNDLGVPTKTGRGLWAPTMVNRMLRREVYATGRLALQTQDHRGILRARRLPKAERQRQGIKLTARPKPQDQWLYISVESIVPSDLWQRAQAVLQMHRRGGRAANRPGHHLPLSGLGRCGECGAPLYYLNGTRIVCSGRYMHNWVSGRQPSTCTLPAKRRWHVEAAVWAEVRSWLDDPRRAQEAAEREVARIQVAAPSDHEAIRAELAALEAQQEAKRAEQQRWAHLFTQPPRGYDPALALGEMNKVGAELEALAARTAQLQRQLSSVPPPAPEHPVLALLADHAWLEEIRATIDSLDDEQRAQIMRQMVGSYILYPSGRGEEPRVKVVPR